MKGSLHNMKCEQNLEDFTMSDLAATCGSVETMDAVAGTTADTAMIPAGSSSYCSCSAVADVDAETTAVAADVR